jgi:hypothetical protein
MKNCVSILGIVVLIIGCATFNRVDFKYTSLAHMNVSDSIVSLHNVDPENLIFALSRSFRAQSYTILERKQLDLYYSLNSKAELCNEALREIYNQEFNSYQENDFTKYQAIDRKEPFVKRGIDDKCEIFDVISDSRSKSWFLEIEIPQGAYATNIVTPDVNSFFLVDGTNQITGYSIHNRTQSVTTNFASRLYIWAWKEPEKERTYVYLEAKPVNEQVVSAPGHSIGHAWWRQSNGHTEYKLVKQYILLLQELDKAEEVLRHIQKEDHSGNTDI